MGAITAVAATEGPRRWPRPAALLVGVAVLSRVFALAGLVYGRAGMSHPGYGLGSAVLNAAGHTYDAAWFDLVVQYGYGSTSARYPAAAFFPGYPFLVSILYWPSYGLASFCFQGPRLESLGDHWLLPMAGVIVSNASLALALILLWKLYEPRFGASATATGLGLLLTWPSAFFLSVGYSEASFLAAVAGSLLLAERGRWGWAGVVGAAACLIRLPGVFLAVPLLLYWLRSGNARPLLSTIFGAAAFMAGALGFHAYLWITFGDPLLYLHLESTGWHRTMGGVVAGFGDLGREVWGGLLWLLRIPGPRPQHVYPPAALLEGAAVVAGAAAMILGWARLRAWELFWILAMLGVPLATGTAISIHRFLLVAFPVFMLAGWWLRSRPGIAMALMAAGTALLFVQATEFARVLPVG